jgi:DNA-binding transcriptional MerR regulator
MTSPALLPIGTFSSATQLSAKALRLYAEHGILLPAKVDNDTGYRYYRPDQIRDARLIRLLRELDMPLADIAALFARPAAIDAALKRHMEFLAQRHSRQQTTYLAALALLRSITQVAPAPIIERHLPAFDVLVCPFDADSNTVLARAHAILAKTEGKPYMHLPIPGIAFIPLNSALSRQDETNLELCIPIDASGALDAEHVIRPCKALSLICIDVAICDGTPDLVGAADALFDWFDRRGASLRDTPRLLLGTEVTQLAWPIT